MILNANDGKVQLENPEILHDSFTFCSTAIDQDVRITLTISVRAMVLALEMSTQTHGLDNLSRMN